MDFEFGEVNQGDESDEDYQKRKVDLYHVLYFFMGSDLMAVTLGYVLVDINILQMGFLFFAYCMINQTNIYYNYNLIYQDYVFLIVFVQITIYFCNYKN